jgi:Ca2+-binding EF-hand superfamily protein
MSAIYVSRLDEKLEFTFKILDFNKDKLVTAKDVHLLLSFIDVESLAQEAEDLNTAGRYTSF